MSYNSLSVSRQNMPITSIHSEITLSVILDFSVHLFADWLEKNYMDGPFPVADPGFSKWGGALFCHKWGAHILFSGKKCMKLKKIGLKWGGARLLAPCYSKITIFL